VNGVGTDTLTASALVTNTTAPIGAGRESVPCSAAAVVGRTPQVMAATDHPAAPELVAECRTLLVARSPSAAPHRIVFVTDKGGVRKSAVAAATALQLARTGQRVLLVELGSRSFHGPWLGLTAGEQTLPWQPRVGVALRVAESALRE
jgi:Mrp family chromosome partitioning ATPase